MSQDHYAVLGVPPGSNEKQIRSAYLKLIRRYHPDASASSETGERARAINLAYVVLRDPGKRAQYDWVRGHDLPTRMLQADLLNEASRPRRLEPLLFAFVVGAAALGLWQYSSQLEQSASRLATQASASQQEPDSTETSDFDGLTAETYTDSILAPTPVVGVNRPEQVEVEVDAPIDLPRSSSQADSSTIRTSLAGTRSKEIAKPLPSPRLVEVPISGEPRRVQVDRTCDALPSKAEIRSCRMDMFAIMDRQLAALFAETMEKADAATRTKLFESRYKFLDRLASCSTDDCVRRAYVARSREVTSIAIAPDGEPH